MVLADIFSLHRLLLVPPGIPDIITLLIGGVAAFLFAYLLTFAVRALCYKLGWLDQPAARRVHTKAVPRLGGVAMFVAFALASFLFYKPGSSNEVIIYWLLMAASLFLVIVNAYDDIVGLKPLPKILAQTIAVLIILGPWDGVFHGILLFTFNNPFGREIMNPNLPWYQQPTFFLLIHPASPAAQPGIGLATGVVGIAGLFITIISFILQQQSIAILAAIFTGAVLGFLPHNWNPAKIFMGDSGSMFLGLGLAVLSVMGGAKLALALMVLGVPIIDVAVVIMNRIRRGQSPLHYDKTHLHHRLMATGLSVRQICFVIYGLALIFGLLAVTLSGVQHYAHFYKFVGIALVVLTMVGLIIWMDYRQRQRGGRIKLGGPDEPTTPNGDASETNESNGRQETATEQHSGFIGSSQPQPDARYDEHSQMRLPH